MPRCHPFTPVSLLAALVACASLLALDVSPLAAQDNEPGGATTTEWQDPTLFVTASTPGSLALTDTPGAIAPASGPRIFCGWFSLTVTGQGVDAAPVASPVVGITYVFICWYSSPWVDPYPGYPIVAVYDPVVDPPGPLVTTPTVARFALDSIDFARPEIITSPADTHVVGVPSWFAVASELDYEPASAQAGPVWATVRPVFRDVVWALGDETQLVCTHDAATTWEPAGPESQHSDCAHLFTEASGPPVSVSATASWTVWQQTDRTAGAWDVWGTISLTSTGALTVIELQAAIR